MPRIRQSGSWIALAPAVTRSVALASTKLVGNLYSPLATLRGYLLSGNPQGKLDRMEMWKEMDKAAAAFDERAAQFTNPENRQKWADAKALLAEFRAAQQAQRTNDRVNKLSQAATRIGDAVELINTIAGQANLLASPPQPRASPLSPPPSPRRDRHCGRRTGSRRGRCPPASGSRARRRRRSLQPRRLRRVRG
ncbi:hypothetical protein ACVW16_003173 [Bradyrhizobium sp. USDA 4474]